MIKVSVIIPVYNSEAYIAQCIRSVTRQTYPELEILIIDDGSTDRSLEICRTFQQKDSRIKVFSQKNRGVSSARNKGLEAACGGYVFFLDSDDTVHPRLLEEYVRQAALCPAGLLFCSSVRVNHFGIKEREKIKADDKHSVQWLTGSEAEATEWFHKTFAIELSGIGGKMIQRSLIGKQRFDESMSRGEDTVFIYDLISRGVHIAYLKEEWYFYRMHAESATHVNEAEMYRQRLRMYRKMRDQEYQSGHLRWALKWEMILSWCILLNLLTAKNAKDKEGSRIYREMMAAEMRTDLYKGISAWRKIMFFCLLIGYSYFLPVRILWRMGEKIVDFFQEVRIWIKSLKA